jgi:glycosyltransferase involved in cell wall biosynthesis
MVLLEAMAAGVPVMATDCGGAPEIVRRAEQLFGLGDADGLARKLAAFFADDDAAQRRNLVDAAGRCLTEDFSDEAARCRFFALPMVRAVVASGQ